MAKKRREWKAWAILMPNGSLAWLAAFLRKKDVLDYATKGERIIRVRIVEET